MKIKSIIIIPGFICNLYILSFKLLIVKYKDYCAMLFIYFISIILSVTSNISILIAFSILEFIKTCYIIYYKSAMCIFSYIYLSLLLTLKCFG